jgi:hypothetical protein
LILGCDPRVLADGLNCAANATSDPVIDILHANDVVLAQISAGLDLDQIERDFSRIFEMVHAAQRDKNRLVLAQQDFPVPTAEQE